MTTKSRVSLGFVGLAVASLAFAAAPADAAGQLSFERVDAVVGSPTNAIRASDLNADGRLDLVVSGGQRVFVLTGRGDGRFDPSWSGAAGENPSDLAIADLDEDGTPWSGGGRGSRNHTSGARAVAGTLGESVSGLQLAGDSRPGL